MPTMMMPGRNAPGLMDLLFRGDDPGAAQELPNHDPSQRPSLAALGNVTWNGAAPPPAWNPAMNQTLAQNMAGVGRSPTAGLGGSAAMMGAAAALPIIAGMTEQYWRPPVERGIEAVKGYGSRALDALRGATGF